MASQTAGSAAWERTVVVGVDFSKENARAVQYAAEEALLRHVPLILMHALDLPLAPSDLDYPNDQLADAANRRLTELKTALEAEWASLVVRSCVEPTSPAVALVDASASAELVVVGSRGQHGFGQLLLGSVAWRVIARSLGPVILVRPDADGSAEDAGSGPVLVGVDGSRDGQAALDFAFEEAARRNTPLVAVNVWAFPDLVGLGSDRRWARDENASQQQMADDSQRVLAEALAGHAQQYPQVSVERVSAHGFNVAETLIQSADEAGAELVVVGARGRHLLMEVVLGAFCLQLAHHARQSVAVVRARGI